MNLQDQIHVARATLRGHFAIKRMADDMRDALPAGGGVTEDELHALGWSRAQIADHASAARVMAQRDAVRRV